MENDRFELGTLSAIIREGAGDNVFQDWLVPARKEMRQMTEQLAMDVLSPQAKMEGLKAAGINPLTAAAGIAGSGSSAAPQPASSTNPIGDIAGAVGAVAGGVDSIANAKIGLAKLPHEINAIDTDASKSLAEIGLTNAQTQGVLTDNTYKDEDWRTRLNVQRQQFENMKAEFNVIKANHDLIIQKIQESISQAELNGSTKDYTDAMTLQIQEQTRWMKEQNDFRIAHKLFINESGIDGYIWSMTLAGMDLDQFDKFVDRYSKWRGSVSNAEFEAQYSTESKYAFAISNARKSGENASDEFYGRFGSAYDFAGKVAALGTRVTTAGVESLRNLFAKGSARDIRNELTEELNNAYSELEKNPNDDAIKSMIENLQCALMLSNRELVDWAKKNKK